MIELIMNGLFVGSLYALFGLGLAVTLGLMQQINLAHGDLIVLSAYAAYALSERFGLHPLAAMPIVAVIMFGVGYLLQRFLLSYTVGRGVMPPLLVTFGLSIVLQNAMLLGFSADTRALEPGGIGVATVDLGGLAVGLMPALFFVFAIVVFALVAALFAGTQFGRAVRATSDDARVARLMGIPAQHIFAVALGMSLAASAIAAVFLGMRSTFSPASGPQQMLFAFEAVVLGGLGSIWGAFIGGLALGLAQSAGLAIAPIYGPLVGHLVFIFALLARPHGLIAKKVR